MPDFLKRQGLSTEKLVNDISSISFEQVGKRLVAWFGTSSYRYSNHCHMPNSKCPLSILSLISSLNTLLNCSFNSVLVNIYKDGNHSIGWHSDDETELDPNHPIASLSIGATRLFQVRHKYSNYLYTLPMQNGMLLIMHGLFQSEFQHRVPPEPNCSSYRINLTFRKCT